MDDTVLLITDSEVDINGTVVSGRVRVSVEDENEEDKDSPGDDKDDEEDDEDIDDINHTKVSKETRGLGGSVLGTGV